MEALTNFINGLSLGSVYAIIALGYTMVYGIAKMLNFAHGDVIMVGRLHLLLLGELPGGCTRCWACCFPLWAAPCWAWRWSGLPTSRCATRRRSTCLSPPLA